MVILFTSVECVFAAVSTLCYTSTFFSLFFCHWCVCMCACVCTFKSEWKTNKRADSFAGVKVTKGKGKIVPLHPMKV